MKNEELWQFFNIFVGLCYFVNELWLTKKKKEEEGQ